MAPCPRPALTLWAAQTSPRTLLPACWKQTPLGPLSGTHAVAGPSGILCPSPRTPTGIHQRRVARLGCAHVPVSGHPEAVPQLPHRQVGVPHVPASSLCPPLVGWVGARQDQTCDQPEGKALWQPHTHPQTPPFLWGAWQEADTLPRSPADQGGSGQPNLAPVNMGGCWGQPGACPAVLQPRISPIETWPVRPGGPGDGCRHCRIPPQSGRPRGSSGFG